MLKILKKLKNMGKEKRLFNEHLIHILLYSNFRNSYTTSFSAFSGKENSEIKKNNNYGRKT